jgi:alkylated DNA repair dioxygenase AlkB
MGYHADNERGVDPLIVSVSLGETRKFRVKPNRLGVQQLQLSTKTDSIAYDLASGDVLVMDGSMQVYWHHGVPKQLRITKPRINITFRRLATIS